MRIQLPSVMSKQRKRIKCRNERKHLPFATRYFVRCFDIFRLFSKTNQLICVQMNKSDHTTKRLILFGMYLIRVGTTF